MVALDVGGTAAINYYRKSRPGVEMSEESTAAALCIFGTEVVLHSLRH
jgi:hypothetical protein